jgi:predicted branched-subunit amino acid permease
LSHRPDSFGVGLRAGTAIAPAVFVIAVSFGVLARDLGWGVVAPIVSSVIVFSGSAQFALAEVLEAGGTALAAIVAAILVNARFAVMGVAVASIFHGGPLRRAWRRRRPWMLRGPSRIGEKGGSTASSSWARRCLSTSHG